MTDLPDADAPWSEDLSFLWLRPNDSIRSFEMHASARTANLIIIVKVNRNA
jgi:hypothetical protein